MSNIKAFLDLRRTKNDGTKAIRIRITHQRKVYKINPRISVTENDWL